MGVSWRSSRAIVSGKRFELASDSAAGEFLSRRGRRVGLLDVVIFTVVSMVVVMIWGQQSKAVGLAAVATSSTTVSRAALDKAPLSIDFDKGDIKGAVAAAAAGRDDMENSDSSGLRVIEDGIAEGAMLVVHGLETEAETEDDEHGEDHSGDDTSQNPKPVPLPPPAIDALTPRAQDPGFVSEAEIEKERERKLQARLRRKLAKRRKWVSRMKRRVMETALARGLSTDETQRLLADAAAKRWRGDIDLAPGAESETSTIVSDGPGANEKTQKYHEGAEHDEQDLQEKKPQAKYHTQDVADSVSPDAAGGREDALPAVDGNPQADEAHAVASQEQGVVVTPPHDAAGARGDTVDAVDGSAQRGVEHNVASRVQDGSAKYRDGPQSWTPPAQPIRDVNRHLSTADLLPVFGVHVTNTAFLDPRVLRMFEGYDIRQDPEYADLVMADAIESLYTRYAPIAYGKDGVGMLTGSSSVVPTDSLCFVKHSGDTQKGYGLYAAQDLPQGSILGMYGGRIVSGDLLRDGRYAWGMPRMALRDLSSDEPKLISLVLDGAKEGNILRFLNDLGDDTHNIDPVWAPVHTRWILFYETTRPVRAGEELSVSYGPEYWGRGTLMTHDGLHFAPAFKPSSADNSASELMDDAGDVYNNSVGSDAAALDRVLEAEPLFVSGTDEDRAQIDEHVEQSSMNEVQPGIHEGESDSVRVKMEAENYSQPADALPKPIAPSSGYDMVNPVLDELSTVANRPVRNAVQRPYVEATQETRHGFDPVSDSGSESPGLRTLAPDLHPVSAPLDSTANSDDAPKSITSGASTAELPNAALQAAAVVPVLQVAPGALASTAAPGTAESVPTDPSRASRGNTPLWTQTQPEDSTTSGQQALGTAPPIAVLSSASAAPQHQIPVMRPVVATRHDLETASKLALVAEMRPVESAPGQARLTQHRSVDVSTSQYDVADSTNARQLTTQDYPIETATTQAAVVQRAAVDSPSVTAQEYPTEMASAAAPVAPGALQDSATYVRPAPQQNHPVDNGATLVARNGPAETAHAHPGVANYDNAEQVPVKATVLSLTSRHSTAESTAAQIQASQQETVTTAHAQPVAAPALSGATAAAQAPAAQSVDNTAYAQVAPKATPMRAGHEQDGGALRVPAHAQVSGESGAESGAESGEEMVSLHGTGARRHGDDGDIHAGDTLDGVATEGVAGTLNTSAGVEGAEEAAEAAAVTAFAGRDRVRE